jgi:hypothetical protein
MFRKQPNARVSVSSSQRRNRFALRYNYRPDSDPCFMLKAGLRFASLAGTTSAQVSEHSIQSTDSFMR